MIIARGGMGRYVGDVALLMTAVAAPAALFRLILAVVAATPHG
jgi:hypothetical protein